MQEAGFFEVFVNNMAQTPVYYDNMTVTHSGGNVVEVNAYYPYGSIIADLSLPAWPYRKNLYKYNAKELQEEMKLNWLDYGARMLDPTVGRWFTPDPLAEKRPWESPYCYTGNNPINRIDPDGMDWVRRFIDDRYEFYYDRDIRSQEDITAKYGNNSGIFHVETGYTFATQFENSSESTVYTFTNDDKENKYGTVTVDGYTLDNSKIIYGSNYTIFGTTDDSVNAETLHKNLMGSYIGPWNPKNYGNKDLNKDPSDSYQYKPTWSPTDMSARQHDLDYDYVKAKGFRGVLSPKTKSADVKLINECLKVLKDPSSSSVEKNRAAAIISFFTEVVKRKP